MDAMRDYQYLPLTPGFFSILVGLLVVVAVIIIQLRILRYAYMRLGMSSGAALILLVATLIGSYFNIPLTELGPRRNFSGEVIDFFGMQYVVPLMARAPVTVVAVNVGGAVIPVLMSIYLLARYQLWVSGALATAGVALVCHLFAYPVPGLGIAVPIFVPAVATAIIAWLLSRDDAAPLAYIAGSLGTLIGADLLNLDKIRAMGAPIASIGGAGTFDGIFLTGILAVLFASLAARPPKARTA
jgi:uncharacterized membrane protein